jgi:hypothetical protein
MRIFRQSLTILMLSTLLVGQSNVGTTAAAFLDFVIGGRSFSMGGALTAVAYDVPAL